MLFTRRKRESRLVAKASDDDVNEPCSDSNKPSLQGCAPEISRVQGKSGRKMLQTEDKVSWGVSCLALIIPIGPQALQEF